MAKSAPGRGEIWLVDLGLTAKVRPCLILSVAYEDEDRALITVLPHTTSIRDSTFEVKVKVPFLRPGAFDAQNFITIPRAKYLRKLGVLSSDQLSEVESSVKSWLNL